MSFTTETLYTNKIFLVLSEAFCVFPTLPRLTCGCGVTSKRTAFQFNLTKITPYSTPHFTRYRTHGHALL